MLCGLYAHCNQEVISKFQRSSLNIFVSIL